MSKSSTGGEFVSWDKSYYAGFLFNALVILIAECNEKGILQLFGEIVWNGDFLKGFFSMLIV